ncbi:MAG: insulinase family protein [Candidatus Eisenbacteria bacterium]|uniref:Insulinase family protein n=1 Tax=Eiseniibacteriota bacterium TaxID=2212470 RepID=A0A948W619_UNCEI|nr:insulinase family protein [Candidatus Eisenbacteria bacterium]MBU1948566.1 insulinase family protein [Candidatus Eisenbacteria bacterium]MBU2691044.1 insulinase family protein [Candidatus Eisenbacteria bacterium]
MLSRFEPWRPAVAALSLLALVATAVFAGGTEERIKKMKFPPLGDIKVPAPERIELSNGIIVYFLENHDFPLVDIQAQLCTGSIYESKDKAGLAWLMGEVMRSGGSEKYPGDELDLILESTGSRLEIRIADTYGTLSLSTLTDNLDQGLDILADVLRRPIFPEDKIDLGKVQMRTDVSSRNDEPAAILRREFRKIIYGENSPYGWHTEYTTIASISRNDLMEFYKSYLGPDGMIMTVYGDFSLEMIKSKMENLLGDWSPRYGTRPADPPMPGSPSPLVTYAHKEGTTSSSISMGHLSFRADDPDYAAMQVLNRILGEGFSSRLFTGIRSRMGLAYSVHSDDGVSFHHPGIFRAGVETRIDSTVKTTEAVLEEIRKIREEGVTEEELRAAKEGILNGLVFDFSSESSVLNRMAFCEFNNYPPDFLLKYQDAVRGVTVKDLRDIAKRRIRPDEFQILVVGDQERFDEPLSNLGFPVKEIDLTIPDPPSTIDIPVPTAETLAEGQRLLAGAAEALGGSAALKSISSLRMSYQGSITQGGNSLTIDAVIWTIFPNRMRLEQTLPFGAMIQVLDGDEGWVETPMGNRPLPLSQIEDMKADLVRDPVYFLSHHSQLTAQSLGRKTVDGSDYDLVHIPSRQVADWVIYLNPENHQIERMDYKAQSRTGPVSATSIFTDWEPTGGIRFPRSMEVRHNGEDLMRLLMKEVEINPGIDPSHFEKPEDLKSQETGD